MRPFRLRPRLTRPPWGGVRLGAQLGKGVGNIGESWEVWRENLLADGATAFSEIVDFPILVKLLDTSERLSVQVHPNDEQARELENAGRGKAEGWLILDVEPGARIAYGLNRTLTAEELVARAHTGEIEADLAWIEPKPGDLIDVPPGTIHAIGGGILLYEIQQPVDLTYRLYDWGRGRELQLEKAAQVARLTPQTPTVRRATFPDGTIRLFDTEWFRLDELKLPCTRQGWEALTVIEGEAIVDGTPVPRGGTIILPPGDWTVTGDARVLAARPPE